MHNPRSAMFVMAWIIVAVPATGAAQDLPQSPPPPPPPPAAYAPPGATTAPPAVAPPAATAAPPAGYGYDPGYAPGTTAAPPGYYPYPYPYPYPYAQPRYAQGPEVIAYDESRPIPVGYHTEERVRKGLVISGPIVLGVAYLPSLIAGVNAEEPAARWLMAPVVGPWISIATWPKCSEGEGSGLCDLGNAFVKTILVFDGLMQLTGAALLAAGIAAPKTVLVRDSYPAQNTSRLMVMPAPMGMSGAGVSVVGYGF